MTKEKIIIPYNKIEKWHDLLHILEQFKYAQFHCLCMARDKAHCQKLAEKAKDLIVEVLA